MKTGRRVADPNAKRLMGTFRADRHADIAVIAEVPKSEPVKPAYMTVEGKRVWDEELPRVMGCGITEADSTFFARYCEAEAAYRVLVMGGELPPASLFTELRRASELLGIAGLRSRLARGSGAPNDGPAPASPFAPRTH